MFLYFLHNPYLLAGAIIGPFVLGFLGEEGGTVMHFAEFGVVMMLFLVGLELEPAHFWRLRKAILGMGVSQVLVTALLLFAGGLLLGLPWQAAVAAGLALAMSSTAIVLQSLKEKGQMHTTYGQASFSVLLFQDIAVIPILALLPLLVFAPGMDGAEGHHDFFDDQPGWVQTLAVLGAVGGIVAAGRYLVGPLLRVVARTRLRELFTASALLLVLGITWLMELVGLSPALGTFLGGVVLANSEYRHELESDLEPFKGLLLGLFFIAVGASIDFQLILENPLFILTLVLAVMALKALVLGAIGKTFRLGADQNLLFALGLSQVGEFAFVLLAFIRQLQLLDETWTGTLLAVTAISMALTPVFSLLHEKFVLPRFGTREKEEKEADVIEESHRVILAGFSHFGSTVGRLLRANGVQATILDHDSDQVELLRKMGFKVFYGDATRLDLLRSAGAEDAKILVSSIGSPDINLQLVETVKKHFPHLTLVVRARNRSDAYELMDLGVEHIYRESLDTSVRVGVDVLKMLGQRCYTAHRAGLNFQRYDEAALRKLAGERHDMGKYINSVREQIAMQEQLLRTDLGLDPTANDHAWDSEYLREGLGKS